MVILESISNYIDQSPLIPVILSSIIALIIIMKSLSDKRFLLKRFIISVILTFVSALFLIFQNEVLKSNNFAINTMYISLIVIEVIQFFLLLSVVDFSLSSDSFQKELKKTINSTKLYCVLNRKDKVIEISECMAEDLGIEINDALGKNFFDVIENKYRIIALNGDGILKDDLKKQSNHYKRKMHESINRPYELTLQLDSGAKDAMYFIESIICKSGRYRGRILIGDKKNEDSLIGLEKREHEAQNELKLLRERFLVILDESKEGIYFNTISSDTIWLNNAIVKKLYLNSNTMTTMEFYKNVHPDDLRIYKEQLANLKTADYEFSYRYNTGNYYVYVIEKGRKIVTKDTIELCGTMTVVNNYSFEKTDTILDQLGNEEDLLNKLKDLYAESRTYELVHFKVTSIPEINEKYGRAIGNMCLSTYVDVFKNEFVDSNLIYRIAGLEFVAIITAYNRMETLKGRLRNDEKILHMNIGYINEKIRVDVNMGLVISNEAPNPSEVLRCAKNALMYSLNPKYTSSYVYYKDMKYNG